MGKKVYGAKGKNGGKHAAEAKSPGCGYVVQPAPQLLRAMVNPRALRTSKVPRCVPTGGALGERACGAWSSNTVNGESLPPVQRPAPAAVKAQQAVLAKMRAQLWRRAHPSAVHQHNLSVINAWSEQVATMPVVDATFGFEPAKAPAEAPVVAAEEVVLVEEDVVLEVAAADVQAAEEARWRPCPPVPADSRWGGRFDVLGRLQGSGDWADLAIDEQDTAVGASADSGTGPEAEADVDDQAAVVGGKADAAMAEDIALPAACAGNLSAGRTAAKAVELPYNLRKPLHKQRDLQRRAREKKRLLKQPLEQWEMDACQSGRPGQQKPQKQPQHQQKQWRQKQAAGEGKGEAAKSVQDRQHIKRLARRLYHRHGN
ncbi:hypothetical protein CHLRE_22g754097v5 [Chlamydomonas reinhardtii]|uniref:Uncharacterized protein n=1 Tax=Chlamydomonas reinhardtii TaxID=3055 RepID=A0A2K3CN76_CHLRE|nr:uncharacterized protein CHLRE_22g754097v5 [Chlamydomonas reinhardtii]PNW69740.1 hypothetical protein CHLRE_22g754097v5 [Chlamydomonas reinhardtii]